MRIVDVLTSHNQICITPGGQSNYINMGLDTEMLMFGKGKILWPDELGLPQERDLSNPKTTANRQYYDFHGDGFATELCIEPATCLETAMIHISEGLKWWAANHGPNAAFLGPSVYKVPEVVMFTASNKTKQLGCMPSMNIYGDPGDPQSLKETDRTTGCHLHMSHPAIKVSEDIPKALVKWADILVGAMWTYISPEDPKIECMRRKAYGRAGEYRLKTYPTYPASKIYSDWSHGVEYRTLPGFVLHHPVYFTLMFNLYRNALANAVEGFPEQELSMLAKDAINEADKEKAAKVLEQINFTEASAKLIKYLQRRQLDATNITKWVKLGSNGDGHRRVKVLDEVKTCLVN